VNQGMLASGKHYIGKFAALCFTVTASPQGEAFFL